MTGTLELLRGARDAFQGNFFPSHQPYGLCLSIYAPALRDAHSICNRLHRDVSASNIILYTDAAHPYSERRAILVDWELSCEDIVGPARDHWLSVRLIAFFILVCTLLISSQGTWSFMSINTIQGNYRPHHICDDIESLIYVVFYCAIHFLPWIKSYNIAHHRDLINKFFNDYSEAGRVGASGKRDNVAFGTFFKSVQFGNVSSWLKDTLPCLHRFLCLEQAAELADNVIKAYTPLFERDDSYWMSLHKKNREPHKLPYKGPDLELHRGTTSLSALEQTASGISATSNGKKRDVSSVDDPDEGSAGKRRRSAGTSELRRSLRNKPLPPK
jgi:serine/threonine protein kinase